MTRPDAPPIEGVYLSGTLDLEALFGEHFAKYGHGVRLRRPDQIDRPQDVRFALTWQPADDSFDPYPNLGLAASIAAGVDSILNCPSLPEAAIVTRLRDESQSALMAGFAAWHVVWHHRRMDRFLDARTRAEWVASDPVNYPRPHHCPVGVLGYGLMGAAIAKAVAAMGFPVVAAVRHARGDDAPDGVCFETDPRAISRTAARTRVLINVLPLTRETTNILNADLFAVMPMGSVLIQLGRGAHLVDADLDAALDSGRLAGASLDVFRQEPLPPEHHWWRDGRILVTPHKASDSSRRLVAEQVSEAVRDFMQGRHPVTAADRPNGY